MTHCLHCRAETSNGLALCDLCQRKLLAIFEVLPVYFRNLARWRPGRAGSRPVPSSRVLWSGDQVPRGDRIADALDEAFTALTTWARALVVDRPHFPRPLTYADAVLAEDLPADVADRLSDEPAAAVALLCVGFEQHLTSIATLGWCGEFVRELDHRERWLRGLTETAVPGWYAGACRRCGVATHVVPGLTWVTCSGCGATTYARDHLDVVLEEARDWIDRPMRLAEAIVALVDTEQSARRLFERIHKWGQRGVIAAVRRVDADGDEVGPRRYRLGDVVERLKTEGQTRTDEAERIGA